MGCGWDEEKGAAREFLTRPLQRGGTTFRTERESSPLLEAFPVVDDFTRALDLDRLGWRSMSASPLVAYACSLHASTDFREKLYKIIQNAAKLVAKQPGGGAGQRTAAQVASTLSQSRGIFKLLKWVNCIETYQTSFGEDDPIVRRLKQTEAWLNATVTMMQDAISLDKLCSAKIVSPRFVWWMNFLDLLLSLLLAGIAANAIRLLQRASGHDSPKVQRKLLLLRLEVGVRLFDALSLLHETSVAPGTKRQLWPAPSPNNAILAGLLSGACATSAVAIKKWAATVPATAPSVKQEQQQQVVDQNGKKHR